MDTKKCIAELNQAYANLDQIPLHHVVEGEDLFPHFTYLLLRMSVIIKELRETGTFKISGH